MQKSVGGLLASYEVVGRGKEWLVVLPGWACSGSEWRKVAEGLGDRYKVVLVDLPGFGGSEKPKEVWGVGEYAEWVKGLMGKIGIRGAVVMGHSFGGRIGIMMAAKWPEMIKRLVLVDAAGVEIKDLKARAVAIIAPAFRWLPQKIKNWWGSPDYKTAGEMRKIFVKVVSEDLRPLFGAIQCPTLVVWGEKDMLLPVSDAKIIHEGIKNSVLRIVWGANHWPYLEKLEDFMRILEEEGV